MARSRQGLFGRVVALLGRNRKGLEVLAVIGALVWIVAAVVTLIPDAGQRLNCMGWHATCPFAPWSSLVLLALAVGCLAAIPILRWLLRRFEPPDEAGPREG